MSGTKTSKTPDRIINDGKGCKDCGKMVWQSGESIDATKDSLSKYGIPYEPTRCCYDCRAANPTKAKTPAWVPGSEWIGEKPKYYTIRWYLTPAGNDPTGKVAGLQEDEVVSVRAVSQPPVCKPSCPWKETKEQREQRHYRELEHLIARQDKENKAAEAAEAEAKAKKIDELKAKKAELQAKITELEAETNTEPLAPLKDGEKWADTD